MSQTAFEYVSSLSEIGSGPLSAGEVLVAAPERAGYLGTLLASGAIDPKAIDPRTLSPELQQALFQTGASDDDTVLQSAHINAEIQALLEWYLLRQLELRADAMFGSDDEDEEAAERQVWVDQERARLMALLKAGQLEFERMKGFESAHTVINRALLQLAYSIVLTMDEIEALFNANPSWREMGLSIEDVVEGRRRVLERATPELLAKEQHLADMMAEHQAAIAELEALQQSGQRVPSVLQQRVLAAASSVAAARAELEFATGGRAVVMLNNVQSLAPTAAQRKARHRVERALSSSRSSTPFAQLMLAALDAFGMSLDELMHMASGARRQRMLDRLRTLGMTPEQLAEDSRVQMVQAVLDYLDRGAVDPDRVAAIFNSASEQTSNEPTNPHLNLD